MIDDLVTEPKGVACCFGCCGLHPDEAVDIYLMAQKMVSPERAAWKQAATFEKKKHLYRNKSCMICGRTYDKNGDLDETWKLTAERVKKEFDNAGVYGVSDKHIEWVVARCRRSVTELFKLRPQIIALCKQNGNWDAMERMTFAGTLAMIITHAQESRKSKVGFQPENIKGLL